MKILKSISASILACLIVLNYELFTFHTANKAEAALDVKGVSLFKDNSVCINAASGGTTIKQGVDLATITGNTDSVEIRIGSSGSLCSPSPFFTGGALLTTTNDITTQAQPNVQSLGRGILISEATGDNTGFKTLINNTFGGVTKTIFEISLPSGCNVIDDDDDIVGTATDLSSINDFSFLTCTSTNGITVMCNAAVDLLTASNGLIGASGSTPAKIHFAISELNNFNDPIMADSLLIRLDSQDIFCPSTVTGSLTATVVAKDSATNPSKSEILGTVNLGTATQAFSFGYATNTATSTKGEISTNEVGTTPLLAGGANTTTNDIQITELDNESISIGGEASPTLIDPSIGSNSEILTVNLWIVPSSTSFFTKVPSSSDISFSDDSLKVSSAPSIATSFETERNAPIGTLIIPIAKNTGGADPKTVKTTITIKNISTNVKNGTVSLAVFEPISGAVVNTPAVQTISNISDSSNPQNFSAFSPLSNKSLAQNVSVNNASSPTTTSQGLTDNDLNIITARNTVLGTPQIAEFTKVISSLTNVDITKITVSSKNSVLTAVGDAGASIGGAMVTIESNSDSTTIISKNDGSFAAKLQADFSKGSVTLSFKQSVSGTNSQATTKVILQQENDVSLPENGLACEQTVCGCEEPNCIPAIPTIIVFVENNGGLAEIISQGGDLLEEVISAVKKALGLD